jgi:hypothetical protein
LRFRHLGHHFLKPGGFADISISKVLSSKCAAAACLNKGLHKRLETLKEQGSLWFLPYSAILLTVAYCDKFSLNDLYDDTAMFDNEVPKFYPFYTWPEIINCKIMTTDKREYLYVTGEILPRHYCNRNLICPCPSISL